MLKKVICAVFLIALFVCVFCFPLSAILIICKLTGAGALSWIGACIPAIIALSVLPFLIIAKFLLDAGKEG